MIQNKTMERGRKTNGVGGGRSTRGGYAKEDVEDVGEESMMGAEERRGTQKAPKKRATAKRARATGRASLAQGRKKTSAKTTPRRQAKKKSGGASPRRRTQEATSARAVPRQSRSAATRRKKTSKATGKGMSGRTAGR